MSALPKISVVMPSLNQGEFIGHAISSVLVEGTNVELIIIDGNSNDKSVDIIKKYEDRLAYWVSEKDKGQSEALNKGFAKATGEIFTWLNSDDLYEPGTLEYVAEFFRTNPDIDVLHGRALLFGQGKKQTVGPKKSLDPWEYLPYMRFPQPSAFFRRSLMEKLLPLNEELHYAMDQELVIKAVLRGARLYGIDHRLSRYRLHESSKSKDDEAFMEEWSSLFSNVLLSLPEGREFAERFSGLKLTKSKPKQLYPVHRAFSRAEVQYAYLEHLHLRLHGFYRKQDKDRMKEILDEIMQIDPAFAKKHQYTRYLLRLALVPGFIHTLYRKLKK